MPFIPEGRPLRNALAHPFAHNGAGPEKTFTRRRKPQRKTFTLGDKMRTENTVLQDRLPPVLGAVCNALLLYKHGRDSGNLALANKRTRVDRGPDARSGNVLAQAKREYDELFVAGGITRRPQRS